MNYFASGTPCCRYKIKKNSLSSRTIKYNLKRETKILMLSGVFQQAIFLYIDTCEEM